MNEFTIVLFHFFLPRRAPLSPEGKIKIMAMSTRAAQLRLLPGALLGHVIPAESTVRPESHPLITELGPHSYCETTFKKFKRA